MKKISISIILPVKNGEQYLKEVLNGILSQNINNNYELIVIDSGSTDNSLDIIYNYKKLYKNLILKKILPSEFGHGRTRNYGASIAHGEFLVFITQDATPASKYWLQNLILPFKLNKKIMGVFGKQIPRKNTYIPIRRNIEEVFQQYTKFGKLPKYNIFLQSKELGIKNNAENIINFMSNVNSALRKSFWKKNKFPDVEYGEDQYMGKVIINKGYIKAYSEDAAVFHSHIYKLTNYIMRFYDEYRALSKIYADVNLKNEKQKKREKKYAFTFIIKKIISWGKFFLINILNDIKYLKKLDKNYNLFFVIESLYEIIIIEISRCLGFILGVNYYRIPLFLHKIFSYDERLRSK